MFILTIEPIISSVYQSKLDSPEAGALAIFEGRVRNCNDGKVVQSLEYEAYTELATIEGEKIVTRAMEAFEILNAICIHRMGHLNIRDTAVWVGITSRHRHAAFSACQFIIDEVKLHVPIWKKEYYGNGDTGWVNCNCTHAHSGNENQ